MLPRHARLSISAAVSSFVQGNCSSQIAVEAAHWKASWGDSTRSKVVLAHTESKAGKDKER